MDVNPNLKLLLTCHLSKFDIRNVCQNTTSIPTNETTILLGSGYHIFAGRDATVPFVTGNFTAEESLKHTDELTAAQLYALDQEWASFYAKEERYHFVGYLCCRFYDEQGQPTEETLRVAERVKSYAIIREAKKKERAEKRKLKTMNMATTNTPAKAPATTETTSS